MPKKLFLFPIFIALTLLITSCDKDDDVAGESGIVGSWYLTLVMPENDIEISTKYTFDNDGTGSITAEGLPLMSFKYKIDGSTLYISSPDGIIIDISEGEISELSVKIISISKSKLVIDDGGGVVTLYRSLKESKKNPIYDDDDDNYNF